MSKTGYQKSEFCLTQGRKISDICLKQGQGMRGRAAPPHTGIYWVPPPPGGVGIRCKKNNISRGIEEFVRVVIMSSCSGTILSISCDLREIQKRYCKLYLGIKIYRQSSRIIFGAHVARSLLWNTLTILHTSCASLSFAEFVALSTVL